MYFLKEAGFGFILCVGGGEIAFIIIRFKNFSLTCNEAGVKFSLHVRFRSGSSLSTAGELFEPFLRTPVSIV